MSAPQKLYPAPHIAEDADGLAHWWIEADERSSKMFWQLKDGRVYSSSGFLETPYAEDLRRAK